MPLRCLLFSSEEETAAPLRQVLASLGVEGEHFPEASPAVDKILHDSFQILIIDWDQQPEAGLLLNTARERKASERPLTLAIVSDDASVPKALQAGANSILRKPILPNQAKETLATARDLLHSRQEPAPMAQAAAASAASVPTLPSSSDEEDNPLRAAEFLQNATQAPGRQYETEAENAGPAEFVDPLKDLEPVAASVQEQAPEPPPPPPPAPEEPRGLEWYLKNRSGVLPSLPSRPAAPAPSDKPELLGFDQTPSYSPEPQTNGSQESAERAAQEQKQEAKLFSYIEGEKEETDTQDRPRFRLGKGAIIGALAIAACAVAATPQAPWHPRMQLLWKHGQQTLHAWLNPQPVTTAQAPESHENFGRAGDEYKLPVAENIPDATTDPSQIQVVPVVDPTAKKQANSTAAADPSAASTEVGSTTTGTDPATQSPAVQVPENQTQPQGTSTPQQSGNTQGTAPATSVPPPVEMTMPAPVPVTLKPSAAIVTTPAKTVQPVYTAPPERVPSSLKSQMASMTPEASGNKAPETALPAIEPVAVPEATERELLAEQPGIAYPENAKGQQGTVVLQVLIGRDGTVQDAKFQQGSLAFARSAIDGVKQYKFKPYTMNGRAVSVQTTLTMTFKPGQ